MIAKGTLKVGYTKAQGLYAYDGVNFFKVFSLYLIHKYLKHRRTIPIVVTGDYLIVGEFVVWFKRDRKKVNQYIDLYERYTRDIIPQRKRG